MPSPDGTRTAYIKDWNLWVRDLRTGKETALTTDGVKDFGYATDNAGWKKTDHAILLWSPDSKKIATFQQDQRNDGDMYLVSTDVGHPKLEAWKYPLPGDKNVTMIQRVIIDVDARKVVRLQMPPDQHRSTLCDDVACRGTQWADVYWSPDATHLAFVSTSRDHRQETLRVADAATGAVRDVFEEKVATFYESGNGAVNWRYLPESNEFIWFSERDNWGQLYLYDLTTGKLKNPITTGDGNVTQVLHVDRKNRVIYFLAVGKEPGEDPYYSHFYRSGSTAPTSSCSRRTTATHDVSMARLPATTSSTPTPRPQIPPTTVLREAGRHGRSRRSRKADISKLTALGWKPPATIVVKARDGKTDLYGLMFTPTNLDATKKYPIVNHIYPGTADRQRGRPHVQSRARRRAGAGGTRLRRRRDRRHGHAVAIEEVPRGLLRRHGATTRCPIRCRR